MACAVDQATSNQQGSRRAHQNHKTPSKESRNCAARTYPLALPSSVAGSGSASVLSAFDRAFRQALGFRCTVEPACMFWGGQRLETSSPSSSNRSAPRRFRPAYPTGYRVFFLYTEPFSTLVGAFFGSHSNHVSVVLSQLANLDLLFVLNVWKTLLWPPSC